MLTSKEQKRVADEISNSSNVIGKGTVLEGNVETYGNIRIEGKVLGSIKRSCVHSFRINDAHGFSVLVVQKKTFLAEGHGLVSNSFGKPLYRGRVENGKLQGQGVLFNTLLQPSPDSK